MHVVRCKARSQTITCTSSSRLASLITDGAGGRAPGASIRRPLYGPDSKHITVAAMRDSIRDSIKAGGLRAPPLLVHNKPMAHETAVRRVLIVEDELSVRELLRLHLELAGFKIEEIGEGRGALPRTRETPFDLLILDVMLPGLDGISLCRAIRAEGPNTETPILMVTARDAESDKVIGLESGADDYLAKPFGIRELLARVGAIMRRHKRASDHSNTVRRTSSAQVQLDADRREAIVRGQVVELTRQEFDLLYRLAMRPGIVYSRATLLQNVWSDDRYVTERTVDTVISRLRKKIERDPEDPELILTAWGVGYKFVDVG
jgi:DNA-binding response OmpR family regulator